MPPGLEPWRSGGIHTRPLPVVVIPELPLTAFTVQRAAELADKPALVDGTSGRALTYGQLDHALRRLAGGLVAAGMAKGEVLGIMAPNIPEYGVVFHGVAMAPLARNEFICWVDDAKQPITRERRIRRTQEELEEGHRRPCCWPGCKHRERNGRAP